MRAPQLAALFLLVVAVPASGQPLELTIPSNIILPNYTRVSVGQEEGLEGGAFIARTGNSLANWYNPAGLAKVASTQINASATAWEHTSITLEGLTIGAKGSRLASIGSFFGGVVGPPILSGDNLRLGFSVTTPIQWRPGTITGSSQFDFSGKSTDLGLTTEVELSQTIPGLAAGFRAGSNVRLGAGLGLAITGLTQRQSVTLRQSSVDSVLTVSRTSTSQGSSYDALLQGGAQWDLGSRLTVGVRASTPGLHVLGSTKLSFESGRYAADRYDDVVFRDPEADFEYRIPASAGAGVAMTFERAEIEADIIYYSEVSEYSLYESSLTGTRTTLVGGVPTVTQPTVAPRRNEWQSVVNVAVGGNYRFSERFRLHAGVYTDASPVADPNSSFFRKVDLIGITGGASWQGTRFSGSLGLGYTGGKADPLRITDPVSGISAETRLAVSSVRAAYALSFIF